MDVDWNGELIDQLESHWQRQLRPRLGGLTDDEYFWQPVPNCWTISRRGASSAPMSFGTGEFTMDFGEPPHDREPVTTIAWRLGHLIVGLAETNGGNPGVGSLRQPRCHRGQSSRTWPGSMPIQTPVHRVRICRELRAWR